MKKNRAGTVPVLALALIVLVSAMPLSTVYAGQQNSYHDPLENWVHSASRTGELDINAVVTSEISFCNVCKGDTKFTMFRTPEYTKDGTSAADQGIIFSDGTKSDGKTKGIIKEGSVYTGYHWTKSVCTKCGSINTNTGLSSGESFYAYGRNVYLLYDCAEDFMKPLEEKTEYTCESSSHHRVTKRGGSYCGICYGTIHEENSVLEEHHFEKSIVEEPGHSRFAEREICKDCGFTKTRYIAAKSVVADYHGKADGKDHSITVTHLSDDGVKVSIYYGDTADNCQLTEAPSYKKAGDYTVYYRIEYEYGGSNMTENGVAYIQLRDKSTSSGSPGGNSQGGNGQSGCSCGNPDCCCGPDCDGTDCSNTCTTHHFILLEKIEPNCDMEGYERYICQGCGKIIEKNRIPKLEHQWETYVIREADCVTEGKVLKICSRCGRASYETTPRGSHQLVKRTVSATCTLPGYTATECTICGEKIINDITPALPHQYLPHKADPTCLAGGHTLHRCDGCGSSFITDYRDALGHAFDEGTAITNPTCMGSGVTEYHCTRCDYKKIEGIDCTGHEPGEGPTCDSPQVCVNCGAVIQSALGHDYQPQKVEPTETELGFTLYTCTRCGDSYKTDYVPALTHKDGEDPSEDGAESAVTDGNGRAVVGGYLIFVNDTDSGNPVEGAVVKLKSDGEISVLLPDGRVLDPSDQVTVSVLNKKTVRPVKDIYIIVSDTLRQAYGDVTGNDGTVTVPEGETSAHLLESHSVYMYGYPDGTFRPDGNMTRAEASAVFARLLAERRGEEPGSGSGRSTVEYFDVPQSEWYSGYIGYLTSFGIIGGENGGRFRPDESITRSELTAIAVRFHNVYSSQKISSQTGISSFSDVEQGDWARDYIDEAYARGWIRGYEDGTFRGQNPITRGEMITITNHLLNREADQEYINTHNSSIIQFRDLNRSHWAYYPIMEASNGHRSDRSKSGESWLTVNAVRRL